MPTPDFSKVWASNSPLPEYVFSDADYLTGWDFVGSAPPTKNEFDAWFRLVDQKLNWLYGQLQDTASKLYPVGSVYVSFNSADPSTLFGGTWQRLKDTFLLANGDTYAPNTSGGSATKTIGVNNMPSHNHSVNSAGSHTHTASTSTAGNHNHTATTSTTGNHTHTRGNMNITGTYQADDFTNDITTPATTGAFTAFKSSRRESENGKDGRYGYGISFDASRSWTGATSTAGDHSHTLTTNTTGNHTHSVTVNSSGSHTHTTNNTGGGLPLNIMPPYQTVYMWKRTA